MIYNSNEISSNYMELAPNNQTKWQRVLQIPDNLNTSFYDRFNKLESHQLAALESYYYLLGDNSRNFVLDEIRSSWSRTDAGLGDNAAYNMGMKVYHMLVDIPLTTINILNRKNASGQIAKGSKTHQETIFASWFHDSMRPRQYELLNKFSDSALVPENKSELYRNKPFEHGDQGASAFYQFAINNPDEFEGLDTYRIFLAIEQHNKLGVNLRNRVTSHSYGNFYQFCHLIKNIDKVAILLDHEVNIKAEMAEFPLGNISDLIINAVSENKLIKKADRKTVVDSVIYQLAWIFEIDDIDAIDILSDADIVEYLIERERVRISDIATEEDHQRLNIVKKCVQLHMDSIRARSSDPLL